MSYPCPVCGLITGVPVLGLMTNPVSGFGFGKKGSVGFGNGLIVVSDGRTNIGAGISNFFVNAAAHDVKLVPIAFDPPALILRHWPVECKLPES